MTLAEVLAVRLAIDPRLIQTVPFRGDAALAQSRDRGCPDPPYAQCVDIVIGHPRKWCDCERCSQHGPTRNGREVIGGVCVSIPMLVADAVDDDGDTAEGGPQLITKLADLVVDAIVEHQSHALILAREGNILDAPPA